MTVRIGVDVGGTKIEVAALDAQGRILVRKRVSTPQGDYAGIVSAIARLVREVEAELAAGELTVGVAMPGAISPATGQIKNANSTCLIGLPFNQDLSTALKRTVRLANDANCFALSEAIDGAARGAKVVFGVILGTGVGGGVVVAGRALVGPNAIAGEWGNNPLPWPRDGERPGPVCYCGRRGCVETFLSGPALARFGGKARAEEVVAAAGAGDTAAEEAVGRYEDRLARALATVINLLDPDVIVLGGGMSNVSRLYEGVPRRWTEYVFSDRVDTRLVRNVHGDSSGVRGAAWLWGDPP